MQGGFLLRRPPVATKGWGAFCDRGHGCGPGIDRLARNLTEGLKTIEELHDKGINIRSLAEGLDTGDDSPTARLMLHMLLSLAEWERETIRDRIKAGVERAAAGGRTGGPAPGVGLREAAGRPGLPGQRRLGQCGRQELRCQPAHSWRKSIGAAGPSSRYRWKSFTMAPEPIFIAPQNVDSTLALV